MVNKEKMDESLDVEFKKLLQKFNGDTNDECHQSVKVELPMFTGDDHAEWKRLPMFTAKLMSATILGTNFGLH